MRQTITIPHAQALLSGGDRNVFSAGTAFYCCFASSRVFISFCSVYCSRGIQLHEWLSITEHQLRESHDWARKSLVTSLFEMSPCWLHEDELSSFCWICMFRSWRWYVFIPLNLAISFPLMLCYSSSLSSWLFLHHTRHLTPVYPLRNVAFTTHVKLAASRRWEICSDCRIYT